MTDTKSGSLLPTPASFDHARDELYSHILRCGVLEATEEHRKEWFDDTLLAIVSPSCNAVRQRSDPRTTDRPRHINLLTVGFSQLNRRGPVHPPFGATGSPRRT
jgi:hypothetical protein